jgi:hypothetical protein
MTRQEQILGKLPDSVRPKVEPWINFLLTIPEEEVGLIVQHWSDEDYLAAYKIIVGRMTGPELDAAMEATNAKMKAAGKRLADRKAANRIFVTDILLAFWQVGKTIVILGAN